MRLMSRAVVIGGIPSTLYIYYRLSGKINQGKHHCHGDASTVIAGHQRHCTRKPPQKNNFILKHFWMIRGDD
jgi:hypothetical protein